MSEPRPVGYPDQSLSSTPETYARVCRQLRSLTVSPWRLVVGRLARRLTNPYEKEMVTLSYVDAMSVSRDWPFLARKLLAKVVDKLAGRRRDWTLDEDYRYQLWLRGFAIRPVAPPRQLSEAARGLRVAILVNAPGPGQHGLRTLASIAAQTLPPHRVVILCQEHDRASLEAMAIPTLPGATTATGAVDDLQDCDILAYVEMGDVLAPTALAEVAQIMASDAEVDVAYTDEDVLSRGYRHRPFFKPDWSPHLILHTGYLGHLLVTRRDTGWPPPDGPWTPEGYLELVLRVTAAARCVAHLPRVLYSASDEASTGYRSAAAAAEVVRQHLLGRGLDAEVSPAPVPDTVRITWPVRGRVSVIIPCYIRFDLLRSCVESIRSLSTYPDYEIVVVYHGSVPPPEMRRTLSLHDCRLVRFPDPRYAFGSMNNHAASVAEGDYLLFLNDDTRVISPGWLEAMLQWAALPEVGAVGARLHYEDSSLNHAGDMIAGSTRSASHPVHAFKDVLPGAGGYRGLAETVRDTTSVTAACMLIDRAKFYRVGGFDERFTSYEDVDLCLRLRKQGLYNVYTPHAVLYHYETQSRKNQLRAIEEYRSLMYLRAKHEDVFGDPLDPYYNANLDREGGYTLPVKATPRDLADLYLRGIYGDEG